MLCKISLWQTEVNYQSPLKMYCLGLWLAASIQALTTAARCFFWLRFVMKKIHFLIDSVYAQVLQKQIFQREKCGKSCQQPDRRNIELKGNHKDYRKRHRTRLQMHNVTKIVECKSGHDFIKSYMKINQKIFSKGGGGPSAASQIIKERKRAKCGKKYLFCEIFGATRL